MRPQDWRVGRLRLSPHKRAAVQRPLICVAPPPLAILPLNQHTGGPAQPCVRVGESVRVGQPIAHAHGEPSAWLHAPVAGRVLAIEPRPAPHLGGRETAAIVIENDGSEARYDGCEPVADFAALAPAELLGRIHRGGIVGLGGAAFPTAAKLERRHRPPIDHLIVNGVECEPYISCDEVLMCTRPTEVLRGVQILLHVLEAPRATLALEEGMPEALGSLEEALARLGDGRIAIEVVAAFYPAGGERQLVTALTGREVPHDGLPGDFGVACQNVGTAAAIARLLDAGEPLISRVVSVTGDGVAEPRNVDARLGTSFARLVADCGGYAPPVVRLIMGGSMMGIAEPHDDLPVVKATNCVIAAGPADVRERGVTMPCIRCGECARVCPAGLLPQQLHWYGRGDDLEHIVRLGLSDCIECGCCDYVCPSRIPLALQFRLAKARVRQHEDDRTRAAQARTRFEARERRLAQEAEERQRRLDDRKRQALQDRSGPP